MKTVSKKLLSLMLVAILLVSALPFQAFADTHDLNIPGHELSGWKYDATNHWQECVKADCDEAGKHLNEMAHTWDANGVCVTCGYACEHPSTTQVGGTAATCVAAGKEADTVCAVCGKKLADGAVIPATGAHDTNGVGGSCSVCGYKGVGASCTLNLDANGGYVNGMAQGTLNVTMGEPIPTLPVPTRPGYTFGGWYIGTQLINTGTIFNFDDGATAKAQWTEITYKLTVRVVLNGDFNTAETIYEEMVPAGQPLLNYLNTNVTSAVTAKLNTTPGYVWEYSYWKDYSGKQPLTGQDTIMNQAQTVYVNFIAKSYTLYFDAGSGTVTPNSKTVVFGSAVGVLPTPVQSGKVFRGWKDTNGTVYDANTIYKIAGNTTLTAVWDDEAMVLLYVYVNGNFSACDRMIMIDGLVSNNNVTRAKVLSEISKHYVAANGYTLSIAGLFDEYTWGSYRANTSKAGVENIQVKANQTTKIYVMINNANTGSTVIPTNPTTVPANSYWVVTGPNTGYWVQGTQPQGSYWVSTGNGNGYWAYNPNNYPTTNPTYPTYYPGTNPKTGDTAQIEVAAAVMILAAAALVTMMALRKKKA